jgi:hypothetical protein
MGPLPPPAQPIALPATQGAARGPGAAAAPRLARRAVPAQRASCANGAPHRACPARQLAAPPALASLCCQHAAALAAQAAAASAPAARRRPVRQQRPSQPRAQACALPPLLLLATAASWTTPCTVMQRWLSIAGACLQGPGLLGDARGCNRAHQPDQPAAAGAGGGAFQTPASRQRCRTAGATGQD